MRSGKEKNEWSREQLQARTRSAAFLSLIIIVGILAFATDGETQATVVGAVLGAMATAIMFYYKRSED